MTPSGDSRRSSVVVRFAGDSGDGMQLVGAQFTNTSAAVGNDLATLPDFPAEIRAPAGTREGVSAFQVQFADHDIFTPGDACDVLVAMNAAALVTNLPALRPGGTIVVNSDKFKPADLTKARLELSPLDDGSLDGFTVVQAPISQLTADAVATHGLTKRESDRCKNFFALGVVYWRYARPTAPTEAWIAAKFETPWVEANLAALHAGHAFAETVELFQSPIEVAPATDLAAGNYRNVTGNTALAIGFAAAAQKSERQLFYGSYPITPASDILHALSRFKNFGVATFQAEDEIAAVCAAIGASWGGSIGVTGTSGPGVALKAEAMGLAVMTELPLVVINVQRGGPSTGLPTKTEQSDLLQTLFGRNGEAPIPVLAAATPSDAFEVAFEAVRIALKYMTPVVLLSDGYIANGAEPWRLPAVDELPDLRPTFRTDPEGYRPYERDPETLVREWALPGTPGLEHRIGGLEKEDGTGNVSYDPVNHEKMVKIRAAKVAGITREIPTTVVHGDRSGTVLVSWGSTFGAVRTAVNECREAGQRVGHVHLRYLNPLPADLGDILRGFEHVRVPELNLGQLTRVLRAELLVDAKVISKVQGQPFRVHELRDAITHLAEEVA